ncbi:chorismate-binding protein [Trinickia caryophylli]|uniref:Anthranilate/para-aminobenzoate synthases component I n=1 Tax=Trinickia caryophylli TaxID=28094 RepID=A0A1X7EF04_TRICW|nr:chorismate-binding protein [Trinickia caryophylli]PMS11145.1 hypothetical protein C0Z17_16855 [Trinickia caryophylli]TRX14604.1 hypothetical protein FNF07_25480 [Trinickia caryophylli]WQE14446.1 chorismate-binding protein [Trinickia caryophylli]SMF32383.1 Anthranilate/para-aminobenzoate synthases component I [Trinickia caryophylli]GLU32151.1 hypothetical protein Busp01_19930 [Trinickia caryophylli]
MNRLADDGGDARIPAAELIADLRLADSRLSLFAFGTRRSVRLMIGVRSMLSVCGRICSRSGTGRWKQWETTRPWHAVARFLEDSAGHFVGGYLGFDLHAASTGKNVFAPYASTRLFVPEVVLDVRSASIVALTSEGGEGLAVGDAPFVRELAPLRAQRIPLCSPAPDERRDFVGKVNEVLRWIRRESGRRCTIARRVTLPGDIDFPRVFAASTDTGATSRSFFASHEDFEFAGTSPELLVDGTLQRFSTYKLSGTYPRSEDGRTDRTFERSFMNDAKIEEEHRLSAGAMCDALAGLGEVSLLRKEVINLPRLRHMQSVFETRCGVGVGISDVLREVLPVGTDPAREGLHLLLNLEGMARGAYYGLVGLIDAHGKMEFSQTLRTAFRHGDLNFAWVGAAVTAGSDPETELNETCIKLNSMELVAAFARRNNDGISAVHWRKHYQ